MESDFSADATRLSSCQETRKSLSFRSKNQRLAFSAREGVIHSHRSRELASICCHQRAAARIPSRRRI